MIWIKNLMWLIMGDSMYDSFKHSGKERMVSGFSIYQTMIHELFSANSVAVNTIGMPGS